MTNMLTRGCTGLVVGRTSDTLSLHIQNLGVVHGIPADSVEAV